MARTRPPIWFRLVAALALLWGAAGTFACVQQWRLGAEAMGPATAYDRALFASLPAWYDPVYAVATGAGLFGALLLLGRSRWAAASFALSLVAVVAMFGWLFAARDIVAVKGAAVVLPFPLLIAAITAGELWLARLAIRRGWIG